MHSCTTRSASSAAPSWDGRLAGRLTMLNTSPVLAKVSSQGMIAPEALARYVDPFFALAGRLDNGAVHVDLGAIEEIIRLPRPHLQTHLVDDVDEGIDVFKCEAAAEVARRGGIGNAACAESVEIVHVVAAQFDVLQAGSVAQGVVGEVEHVVGFVIGQVKLEQMQPLVDGVDQSDPPGQQVDSPNAAARDAADAIGHLVMDVARAELRLKRHCVF